MAEKKYVYAFEEGKKEMKEVLGGKGANLAEMTNIGIPVPPGFTITAVACKEYYDLGQKYPESLTGQVEAQLKELEGKMGKTLGDEQDPLLVSVRSGAAISMPGMMDTILNLGLNDVSVNGFAKKINNEKTAWDSYRRFIQMFGNVVKEIDSQLFENELEKSKQRAGVEFDKDLSAIDLKNLVVEYKKIFFKAIGEHFPQDPVKQLWMAIDAVFSSWNNKRAITYRRLNNITGLLGTAVNVQSMVFGNMGETSATGVCFSRDPSTGERIFYGEYLVNAQGEDVVAGIRTPQPLTEMAKNMPKVYSELVDIKDNLEAHYKDMQDMEFTIQEQRLFLLQTRVGKRTAAAAVRLAIEMAQEGLITKKEAVLRVDADSLEQLLHKRIDPDAKDAATALAKGLPASPGAAVGQVYFEADIATDMTDKGQNVILVRTETSPEDIEGMYAAKGILTSRGGMTSHAAVVARGMGTCCVAGCGQINVEESAGLFTCGDTIVKEGDFITLDGSTGEIFVGKLNTLDPEFSENFNTLMSWADEYRKLKVKANAETEADCKVAKEFGAEGIGLARTEHMFFDPARITSVRKMILAEKKADREKFLDELVVHQKGDFLELFKIMSGLPVIVRLLDPPLHEFLPHESDAQSVVANSMGIQVKVLKRAVDSLKEFNPMLGFRGCRLGVKYPEITAMQAKAIFMAALEAKKDGFEPIPYIEVPLIGGEKEYVMIRDIIADVAKDYDLAAIKYKIGAMVETPRACLVADKIADEAQFLSFGTNDLTQMGCGFSRDDAGKFLDIYIEKEIYKIDPFTSIDQEGIGQLMQICVEKARETNPDIEIGICGEHGGNPASVEFCSRIGLNDVSCSPFRLPIAKLAAAQAALK